MSPTFLPRKSGGCGLLPLGLPEVRTHASPAFVSFHVQVTSPGTPPVVLGASVVDDVVVSVVVLLVSVVVLLVSVVELLVDVDSVVELLVDVLSVVDELVDVLSVVELLVDVEVLVLVVVVGCWNSCLPELCTRVALFA